jgi:hypothetical protein
MGTYSPESRAVYSSFLPAQIIRQLAAFFQDQKEGRSQHTLNPVWTSSSCFPHWSCLLCRHTSISPPLMAWDPFHQPCLLSLAKPAPMPLPGGMYLVGSLSTSLSLQFVVSKRQVFYRACFSHKVPWSDVILVQHLTSCLECKTCLLPHVSPSPPIV